RRAAGALRETLDLVGNDRESLAALARLRGDDRRVQGEQRSLVGDVGDDVEDVLDLVALAIESLDDPRDLVDLPADVLDGENQAPHRVATLARIAAHFLGERARLLQRAPD